MARAVVLLAVLIVLAAVAAASSTPFAALAPAKAAEAPRVVLPGAPVALDGGRNMLVLRAGNYIGRRVATTFDYQTVKRYQRPLNSRAPPGVHIEGQFLMNFTTDSTPDYVVNCFLTAAKILDDSLDLSVQVLVEVTWVPQEEGVLGSASPQWDSAVPLSSYRAAGALAVQNSVPRPGNVDFDILAQFNSNFNSYYQDTDGKTPDNKYDLVTVALHELCHGMGFSGGIGQTINGGFALRNIAPNFRFDEALYYNSGQKVDLEDSNDIETAITSTTLVISLDGGATTLGKLFSPKTYQPGSTTYHWNENTYKAGDVNTLMTPSLGFGESCHILGPITLTLFGDMGYDVKSTAPTSPKPKKGSTSGITASIPGLDAGSSLTPVLTLGLAPMVLLIIAYLF